MKRISWTLTSYVLPDFKIYDKTTHNSSLQVPIDAQDRPSNNTYFIGIVPDTDPVEKLLCYHITEGKYIVVSYNYNSARLLQDVLSTDIYNIKVAEYEENGTTITKDNPSSIPVINSTITSIT